MDAFQWWVLINFITAVFGLYVAAEKNRNLVAWFILCFFFGLIALVAVAGIPAIRDEEYLGGGNAEALRGGATLTDSELQSAGRRETLMEGAKAWNPLIGPPPRED